MRISFTCKLCGLTGSAECDDQYKEEHDPNKLSSSLCHDRCFDIHMDRRKIESGIEHACNMIAFAPDSKKQKVRENVSDKLTLLTKKYAENLASKLRCRSLWEVDFVNMLSEQPEKWADILSQFRKLYTKLVKQ